MTDSGSTGREGGVIDWKSVVDTLHFEYGVSEKIIEAAARKHIIPAPVPDSAEGEQWLRCPKCKDTMKESAFEKAPPDNVSMCPTCQCLVVPTVVVLPPADADSTGPVTDETGEQEVCGTCQHTLNGYFPFSGHCFNRASNRFSKPVNLDDEACDKHLKWPYPGLRSYFNRLHWRIEDLESAATPPAEPVEEIRLGQVVLAPTGKGWLISTVNDPLPPSNNKLTEAIKVAADRIASQDQTIAGLRKALEERDNEVLEVRRRFQVALNDVHSMRKALEEPQQIFERAGPSSSQDELAAAINTVLGIIDTALEATDGA